MRLSYDQLPQSQGQVLCQRLQKLLHEEAFDAFPKKLYRSILRRQTRPQVHPAGRSCRMLLIGCFGDIDSERGICWRSLRFSVPAGILRACPR